ncbi:hypothetical protein F4806DRAFT_499741 [Annulohypoxylon nitens]|nr:hypothetical protein F4806DRAFT_499741 [Annulohypoxylon nitens]
MLDIPSLPIPEDELAEIQSARSKYRTLKRDTELFKRWLNTTAESCGWATNHPRRKQTTEDITAQIDLLLKNQNKSTQIPTNVHLALRNAINGRRLCNKFFHESNLSTQESRDGHEHFIRVLERAANVLPRRRAEDIGDNDDGPRSSQESADQLREPLAATPIVDQDDNWQVVKQKKATGRL